MFFRSLVLISFLILSIQPSLVLSASDDDANEPFAIADTKAFARAFAQHVLEMQKKGASSTSKESASSTLNKARSAQNNYDDTEHWWWTNGPDHSPHHPGFPVGVNTFFSRVNRYGFWPFVGLQAVLAAVAGQALFGDPTTHHAYIWGPIVAFAPLLIANGVVDAFLSYQIHNKIVQRKLKKVFLQEVARAGVDVPRHNVDLWADAMADGLFSKAALISHPRLMDARRNQLRTDLLALSERLTSYPKEKDVIDGIIEALPARGWKRYVTKASWLVGSYEEIKAAERALGWALVRIKKLIPVPDEKKLFEDIPKNLLVSKVFTPVNPETNDFLTEFGDEILTLPLAVEKYERALEKSSTVDVEVRLTPIQEIGPGCKRGKWTIEVLFDNDAKLSAEFNTRKKHVIGMVRERNWIRALQDSEGTAIEIQQPQPIVAEPITLQKTEYLKGEQIGEGGASYVYKAAASSDFENMRFALKLLKNAAQAKNLVSAAKNQMKLKDIPGIVKVIDVDEEKASVVMELVDGLSLQQILDRQKPINVAEATAIILPTAKAIDQAHKKGVLHGDLKPHQILLSYEKETKLVSIKVTDFAADSAYQERPAMQNSVETVESGSMLGTPQYMAPEQLAREAITPKTDVYGLAATLYRLLAGKPPVGKWKTISQLRPDLPSAVSRKIDRLLEETLCEPHERLGTVALFIERLEDIQKLGERKLGKVNLAALLGAEEPALLPKPVVVRPPIVVSAPAATPEATPRPEIKVEVAATAPPVDCPEKLRPDEPKGEHPNEPKQAALE